MDWMISDARKIVALPGKKLALVCKRNMLRFLDWKNEKVIRDVHSSFFFKQLILPDEKTMAAGTAEGKIFVFGLEDNKNNKILKGSKAVMSFGSGSKSALDFLALRSGMIPLLAAALNTVFLHPILSLFYPLY